MLWMLFVIVLGGYLRFWHLSSQALLDDEWHALNFVLNRSFTDVLIQQGLGANSIPVNIYSWLILHSTGWSEPLLRIPSIVSGIAALIVIPLLVHRIWGNSVACITAALLAVSPVVIFYSRITRPYAPAMFLATVSILLIFSWLNTAKRRDLLLSVICGSLAIYYHLYAVIPVGIPFVVALVAAILPKRSGFGLKEIHEKPLQHILQAAAVMIVIVGLLVVVPNVLNPWWSEGIHNVDHANRQTAITVLSLISGTNNGILMVLTLGLLLTGFARLIVHARIAGSAIILSFVIFALIMSITTQDGAHAGIQVARYGITFFPLAFITIAVALAWIGDLLRAKFIFLQSKHPLSLVAAVVWIPFLAASPLWTTYSSPNNFTSHSAYQFRYEPILWQERTPERDLTPGVSLKYELIPKFYLQSPLLASAKGIIEYPVLIGDQLNLNYYYQHFHGLPVVAGFVSNNHDIPVEPGRDFVFGGWTIDSVMSAIPDELGRKSTWHSMVDLNDNDVLRRKFKGWLVIIHRDPLDVILNRAPQDYSMSVKLVGHLTESNGNPDFFDEQIAVWMIK